MAGGDLFQDLPPPSDAQAPTFNSGSTLKESSPTPLPKAPAPALKSALKRTKPPPSSEEAPKPEEAVSGKRLRFKTTTDASESQVIDAMQKIGSHIKNTSKFSKASKLAIQLIQAGSVKPSTGDHFFAILEGAMSSPTSCNEASVRADYHALFSAAQDTIECFNKKQQDMLRSWMIRAVVANDLFTDDSFVFAKASGRIREAISSLPVATVDDDKEEAAALDDVKEIVNAGGQSRQESSAGPTPKRQEEEEDPFGLDALIPSTSKKDDKAKGKREGSEKNGKEEDENKRFLKAQREALISCLEIAARRYKIPWCQTVIDILVKHAYDNVSRFTSKQRDAIDKLWVSIREQHMRRKQGKSVSGKLDVNAFEHLQQKYATQKISIRHAVGGSGERRCTQWLG